MFVLALIATIQWGMTPANAAETDYGNRYVKMDTAYLHGMALRANGTIADWGFYLDGIKPVPSGLTGVVDIAEGWSFSVALKSDGIVVGLRSDGTIVTGGYLSNQFLQYAKVE